MNCPHCKLPAPTGQKSHQACKKAADNRAHVARVTEFWVPCMAAAGEYVLRAMTGRAR
jgi:hypothetical protein